MLPRRFEVTPLLSVEVPIDLIASEWMSHY